MHKPRVLAEWEAAMPRICVTCLHHAKRDSTDSIYCKRYDAEPPCAFTEEAGACADWRDVAEEIPF